MEIYYQGTDITDMVRTRSCIVHDTVGRSDSLILEFENAAAWYKWAPEEDDQIAVTHNKYDSGMMYVNKIIPENGNYRMIATSLPCKARNKGNRSFVNKTLGEIMKICAMVSDMDWSIFGLDENLLIPYVEQEREGCAAFLSWLVELEGGVLKCINGRYTAIGVEYAQNRQASQTIELLANQDGVSYQRDGTSYSRLEVKSPYAQACAVDEAVSRNHAQVSISGELPVLNSVQAGRWARGKLLSLNRKTEQLTVNQEMNAGLTALSRIDVTGGTDADGEWLVYDVEHDLTEMKTSAIMHRLVTSIR